MKIQTLGTLVDIKLFPLDLTNLEVIEEYEGDIFRQYTDKLSSDTYLEKWCDCDHEHDRFVVTKASPELISKFIEKSIHMLELISANANNVGFLIDYDLLTRKLKRIQKVNLTELPKSYFPTVEAFHDDNLNPKHNEFYLKSSGGTNE